MRKLISLLMTAVMLAALCSCGAKPAQNQEQPQQEEAAQPEQASEEAAPEAQVQEEAQAWTRVGFFTDAGGNMMSINESDIAGLEGWYVTLVLDNQAYGNVLQQKENTLQGNVVPPDQIGEFLVTISEEGTDGLLLTTASGETYSFAPKDLAQSSIEVRVDVQGPGHFTFAEYGQPFMEDYPYTWTQFGLARPATYMFVAEEFYSGWSFVKWTKNGQDYASDRSITVELTEDVSFTAVYAFTGQTESYEEAAAAGEADADTENGEAVIEDGQNPVMNVIGEYAAGRAHALVQAEGQENALVTIEWGDSAMSLARWVMHGPFDLETLTVDYTDCVKTYVVYKEGGEIESETVEYENGTGQFVFDGLSGFTWHDDMEERDDVVFEWVPHVPILYGESELYTYEEMDEAIAQIQNRFAEFEGCELHSIAYAGDEACTEENLNWMNELNPDGNYTQVIKFLMDFHSPVEGGGAWEPDYEFVDYEWWLARPDGGSWEVVTTGYN